MASNHQIKIGVGFQVDTSGLSPLDKMRIALDQIIVKAAKAKDASGGMPDNFKRSAEAAEKLQGILNQSWNHKLGQLDLGKVSKGIKDTYGNVEQMKAALTAMGPEGTKAYNQVASSILNTNIQLKQSNKLLDSMAQSMANTIKWGITSAIFNSITSSISKAYGYTKKLDSSLNNIRIVTNKSAEDMEQFAKAANSAAKSLGSTTLDYTEASLIYYQQGLSDADVQARTETTLKAANVTGQHADAVSEQLTAVWNGYKVSAQEAELYIDKLAAVATTTASDLEELSTGMSKVASAASSMGVDIDQLNAQLATIVSVTRQAPESVGTALKTIYARMSDLKLGETDEDGLKLGDVSGAMSSMGIDVLDASGNLREMGDVIEEVAAKWNTWTEAQKTAMAQVMAGKRQYNNLVALFENWDMYTNALNESANATGTLNEQNEIYLESTAAHLKQLSTEAERTYDILFNPKTVNGFTDVMSGVLGIFNDFIESIGGGGKAILYFGSLVATVFNQQIARGIQGAINNFQVYRNNLAGQSLKTQFIQSFTGEAGQPQEQQVQRAVEMRNAAQGKVVSTEAVKAEAAMAQKILAVEKGLTQEQHKQLVEMQQRVGLIQQEYEDLMSYKTVFQELWKNENMSLEEATINLNSMNDKIKQYEEYKQKVKDGDEGEVGDIIDKLLNDSQYLSADDQTALQNMQSKPQDINRKAIENAILQVLRAQGQEYQKMKQAVNNLEQVENGRATELDSQRKQLEGYIDDETKLAKKQIITGNIIKGATAAIGALTAVAGGFSTVMSETATEAEKINAYGSMISGAATSIGMALGPWGMVVGGTISAITTMITSSMAKAQEELQKGIEENKQKWQELKDSVENFNSNKKTLKSLQGDFERLAQGVSDYGTNISLTESEYEEYKDIVNQIAKITPDIIAGYDAEGNAIANKNQLIEKSIELMRQEQEEKKKALVSHAEMELFYEGAAQEYEAQTTEVKGKKVIQSNREAELNTSTTSLFNQVETGLNNIYAMFEANEYENLSDFGNTMNNFLNAYKTNGVVDVQKIQENTEEFFNTLNQIKDKYSEDFKTLGYEGDESDFETKLWKTNENMFYGGSTTEVATHQIAENYKEVKDVLKTANKELKAEEEKQLEQQKAMNNKVLTYMEVYSKNYKLLGTQKALAVQNFINGFKTEEFTDEVFEEFIKQTEKFISKLSLLGDEQIANFNKLANPKNFDTYQEYINNILAFAKEAKTNGMDLTEVAQALGVEGLRYDAEDKKYYLSDDNITKKNQINTLLQEMGAAENFNVAKYFSEEDIENADLENLQIGKVNLKSFIDDEGFNTAKFNEYAEAILKTDMALKKLKVSLTERKANIDSLSNGLSEFSKEGKISAETIADLERRYPELTDIQLKNSHMYLNALREIREYEETAYMQDLKEQKEMYAREIEYFNKQYGDMTAEQIDNERQENSDFRIQYDADVSKVNEAIEKLIDTEYQMTIQIEADLQSDIDSGFGLVGEFQKLGELVSENLEISMDRAQEIIADGNAGILENSTKTSNDTIKLDKETRDNYIDNRQKELEATRDTMLEEYKLRKTVLEARRDAAKKELDALVAAQEAYNNNDIEGAEEQLQIAHAMNDEYQSQTEQLNSLLTQEGQYYTEKGKLSSQYFKDSSDDADTASENIQLADIAATKTQAEQTEKKLHNNELVWQSYVDIGNTMRWSENPASTYTPTWTLNSTKIKGEGVKTSNETETNNFEKEEIITDTEYKAEEVKSETTEEYVKKMMNFLKTDPSAYNKSILNSQNKYMTAYNNVGANDAIIAALEGAGISLDKKQSGAKDDKDKKEEKRKEDEIDRYWELNRAIENVEESLSDLDKQQEKLYGKEKIKSLKEENKLLAEQADKYRALAEEQRKEASELQGILSNYGVVFDAQGAVSNYLAATQAMLNKYNQAVAAYNAGLIDEATFGVTEKAYENFKSTLERYETLYYNEMRETQNKLDDIHRQELENNLEAWEIEIQLKLDMKELKRQWNDFFKEINENFKLVYEDLGATMKNLVKNSKTYKGKDGDIATIRTAISDVTKEIDKMRSGGSSDMFESISQAQEKLKELNEQLMDSATALRDLWEEAWDTYLEGIDQTADKFEDIMEQYEKANEQIEYQKELIELLYGDEAYNLMSEYYEAQLENTLGQVSSLKQQADMWKQQYEIAKAIDEQNGTTSEDTKKFYEEWQEAQDKVNDKVKEYIKLLQDDYKNTIKEIFSDLEKYMTGGTNFDYVKEEWDLLQKQVEGYYDDIEKVYQLNTLANKYEKSIANTAGVNNQKKLQELYDKEMKYLENKKDLSEYDIEIANAKYEMTLKQIALEEAQQNKNAMKLTRGADGNWSYQYVANEEEVQNKQQELLDATNNYYKIAKEGFENNLEEIITLYAEYQQKMMDLEFNRHTMTDEEYEKQKTLISDTYISSINKKTSALGDFKNNIADATLKSILNSYQVNLESYEWMTEEEKSLLDELKNGILTSYDEMLNKAMDISSNTLNAWQSTAMQIANLWYSNPTSVKQEILNAYAKIEQANKDYQDAIDELEKTAEQDFGEEGIKGAIDDARKATNHLEDATKQLVKTAEKELPKYREQVNKIEQAWYGVKSGIESSIATIEEYLKYVGEVKSAAEDMAISMQKAADSIRDTIDARKELDDVKKDIPSTDEDKSMYYYLFNGKETRDSSGNVIALYNIFLRRTDTIVDGNISLAEAKKKYGDGLKAFNTGGYTGEWNDGDTDGRLAWLHQKELVLNSVDTANILSVVDTVRDLTKIGSSIESSIMNNISQMLFNLMNLGSYGQSYQPQLLTTEGTTENIFHINAEFPNADDVSSIREAIMSLPNLASQYIARNKK